LSVDESGRVDDSRLFHLEVQIVSFARTLADAAEHRLTAMSLGDVVNQLHDDDGLADAGAAEESDLSALHEWRDEVDDLDTGLKDFCLGLEVRELRGRSVNWPPFDTRRNLRPIVDGVAKHVQNSAERSLANRNPDRPAGILDAHSAYDGVGRRHRDCANLIASDVLLHFHGDVDVSAGIGLLADAKRIVKLGQVLRLEFDVEHGSDDLHYLADVLRLLRIGIRLGGLFSLSANGCCHDYPCSAAAPPTISAISCVICA